MEPIEPPPGCYWPEDDDPDAFQLESLDPSPGNGRKERLKSRTKPPGRH